MRPRHVAIASAAGGPQQDVPRAALRVAQAAQDLQALHVALGRPQAARRSTQQKKAPTHAEALQTTLIEDLNLVFAALKRLF